jgi:pSer/pThr/pTyr-binding forkhead associated (FHA) protein
MWYITCVKRGGPPRHLPFEHHEVTIGTEPGNDIVLDDPYASPRHARILQKEGKNIIVDLKTDGGTFVNGRRITAPQVLRDGEKITLGLHTLEVGHGEVPFSPFVIEVRDNGGSPRVITFNKPEVTIGRVDGNDIVLPKGNVGKRHSRIAWHGGAFVVVDLKSTNGTFVNGVMITAPTMLRDADQVVIGDFTLTLGPVPMAAALLLGAPDKGQSADDLDDAVLNFEAARKS